MVEEYSIYNNIISVLVVDDSLTSRALIMLALKRDPRIKVVGTAGTPLEAKDLILKLQPDVLTLDVEMPGMNGLQFLEKIMRLRPMPVVMVSSLMAPRSAMTDMACRLGAVECFSKSSGMQGEAVFAGLADAVVRAAVQTGKSHSGKSQGHSVVSDTIVAIGASTGGVEALGEVLGSFPEDCPPTIIVQHMPQQFSNNFARRLNAISRPDVSLVTDGCKLIRGKVLIAPGGEAHTEVSRTGRVSPYSCHLVSGPPLNGHRPSVDALFLSVAQAAGRLAIGVILTGMEADGARGLLAMKRAGARTIGQDRETSVIYGMPKAAFECGAVEMQLPLPEIGPSILRLSKYRTQESYQ
ncbi:protein-glutamate methylesterase/protein-glutamine glutaminase [Gluconobacter japonicus]|uniref:protein-glutamate methylesterase/protein-glutamine glutaminase n=1 Tax=Gluconobacter japonicus TaxID=376620 RepID=UPI0007844081|nr:chemotaxis response regulator protein-glutamate methylesterase [Gluconobacter japonicus]KXV21619.1 chemotaxis protein [Gluconobacter japonicus]